jgi:hypothetical protein
MGGVEAHYKSKILRQAYQTYQTQTYQVQAYQAHQVHLMSQSLYLTGAQR